MKKLDIYDLFFFQAEDGIRDRNVTGVQTCALPISKGQQRTLGIEHPSGTFDALVDLDANGAVVASGNTRTARLISRGDVYVPKRIWDPTQPKEKDTK